MSKKTFYGFDYQDVQDTMNRYMPYVIEDINHLVDDLMQRSDAVFICHDELEDNEDFVHGWQDMQLYYKAHLEIIRQLNGFMSQCLPPIISDREPPFLLPHQLVPEYVDSWMSEIANSGYDDRERASVEFFENGGYEKLFAEMRARRRTLSGRVTHFFRWIKNVFSYAARTYNNG